MKRFRWRELLRNVAHRAYAKVLDAWDLVVPTSMRAEAGEFVLDRDFARILKRIFDNCAIVVCADQLAFRGKPGNRGTIR